MNNLKAVILLALGVTLFTSCTREYKCNCRDTGHDIQFKVIEAKSVKDAKSKCMSMTLTPEGNSCTYDGAID